MSELYENIVNQRGGFEKILARIPGFSGYIDRAARRTADRMIRDYVAGLMTEQVNRLINVEKSLLKNGGLQYMSETASVKTKLQTYRDRIKAAAPGYSGFMAARKIEAEQLEKLYAFDEAQMRYADQFAVAIEALSTAVKEKSGIEEAIEALDALTIEANEAFSLREQVLIDLDKSLS